MNAVRQHPVRTIIIAIVALFIVASAVVAGPLLVRGPRIVSVSVVDGASNVNPQQPIRVEFDQWIDPQVVAAAVNLEPAAPYNVVAEGTARPWHSTVLITPNPSMQRGAHYKLRFDQTLRNIFGITTSESRTIAFTTAPYATIARTGPANGTKDVPVNAPITVEFGAPVVAADAVKAAAENPTTATLPQPLSFAPPLNGVGRWLSPTRYSFSPADGWIPATTYTATISDTITPDGQSKLEKSVSWQFTTEAKLLVGTRPADGATDVAPDGAIEVQFAPGVDPHSAGAKLTLTDKQGQPVPGSVEQKENALFFKPAAALQRGAVYQATLGSGVTSVSGGALNAQPQSWTFTTMGDLDVLQVEPPRDTTEVLIETKCISVRFNHPVVALTNVNAQQSLPQPLAITPALQGVGQWLDTRTYVFSPTVTLAPATKYDVQVSAGLKDQTGGELKQPYAWTFSTINPAVISTEPSAGAKNIGASEPLLVVFNQPMDPASLNGALKLRDANGTEIAGSVAISGTTTVLIPAPDGNDAPHRVDGWGVRWTPAAPLARGEAYTLSVPAGTRGAQAGTLASDFDLSFRVAPNPRVVSSQPAAGEQAAQNSSVDLMFSAPMNWASVSQNVTITPKPTQVYTSGYDTQFALNFDLKPETDYTVSLSGAAKDAWGVSLGQDTMLSFRTAPLAPSFSLVGGNRVAAYNAASPVRVPIQHVNLPAVAYDVTRMEPLQAAQLAGSYEQWQQYKPNQANIVLRKALELQGTRNKQALTRLELGNLEPGAYMFDISGSGNSDRQLMIISRATLTIKRSYNKLFIWAVDMATGQPIADLPLIAATYTSDSPSEPRELGRTDAEGILQVPFDSADLYNALYVWSPPGPNFAFATTEWNGGINAWDFGLPSQYTNQPFVGNIATDRPIYRPDQNVYIRGAVRRLQDDRYSLADKTQPVFMTVSDPQGNTIITKTLQLSEFGTFNTSLPLASDAKVGNYNINARLLDGANKPDAPPQFYGSFSVAEYRKPTFEISVTPAKPDLIQGDRLNMTVSARYFAGGALANAPVRWNLSGEPLYFAPESAPNFRFEDLDDASEWYRWFDSARTDGGDTIADGTATTDAQGNFVLDVLASLAKDNHSRKLTLNVDISDIDGQVISSQGTVNVHTGHFYIGLRPDAYVGQTGQPQNVSLITLDPQGQVVPNRAVSATIYKREWYSARQQGADGQLYWTSNYTDTLLETKQATTDAQGRASISFTTKLGGSYRIGAEAKDDAGHTIKASAFMWVGGGDVFWGVDDTNRVDLIADKDRYKPGDTASVLVTAPYPGMRALMTIERGNVISHKLFTLNGTTEQLAVPITADYAPNVYVSVVLLKPANGQNVSETQPAVPDMRVGLVNLPVSIEQQELNITVTPDKPQAGPRDNVTYTVKATDNTGAGVRAELGLALVDKAVLSLQDDANPTLQQSFYEKRPLGVQTAQSLTALVDRTTIRLQSGGKGGGGGGAREVLVRRDFPDTAYWNPALVTGADGTASFSVKLPDSLTTWRLSARGITSDTRVGQATQDVVATRPLFVRAAFPRFLTAGDKPALQAVVHNTTGSAVDATVSLEIGATGANTPTITLEGAAQQTVNVPANGETLVRWPVTVGAAHGTAKFTLQVSGGGQQDIVEQLVQVQQFSTPETVATAGQVFDQLVETIAPSATGELNLELVPSLAAGVTSGLDYLDSYPYLCTEQTVSRFLPNAVSYRLFKQAGLNNDALRQSLERNLAAGQQRLSGLQNLDGGWGWWGNDESQPYLSAYVVQGLIEARNAGYGVDQRMLDQGISYLKNVLENQEPKTKNQSADNTAGSRFSILGSRAYVLFVLGEAGQANRGRTVAAFEQRAEMDVYARAYLLMTLKRLGGEDERVRTLVGELMSTAIMHTADAHWEEKTVDPWTMSSDVKTTALALQALVRSDPENVLVPNAVRFLMAQREDGHWRTTQESAVSLIALAEYLAQSGELNANYTYHTALGNQTLRDGTVNKDNLAQPINFTSSLTATKQASRITISKSGAGRLYYTLRLRSYADAATVQPLDRGIAVQREYIAVNTDTLSSTGQLISDAKLGDVVQVRLTINVPENVYNLAVEDMLPAGLEALDTSLKHVSSVAHDPALQPAGGEREGWTYVAETAIHDNRVAMFAVELPKGTYTYTYLARATTPGTFQTLPTTAYQMYAPEVFGRGAGSVFTVK